MSDRRIKRRYGIVATKQWRTIEGDGMSAVLKDKVTGRAFIVLGDRAIQERVAKALNLLAASEAKPARRAK